MTNTERPILPPMSNRPAEWWTTSYQTHFTCPRCRRSQADQPAVLRYNPAFEYDRANPQHPGWAEKGWLAWFQCRLCDENLYQAVLETTVASWGRHSGWRPLDPDDEERMP